MPTPMPKHVEVQFYHVIGAIVVRYGTIDSLVAQICSNLIEDFGGHSSQKEPPRRLSVRLELIGKCFRNKPELAEMTEFMAAVCDSIKNIDVIRHYLVHGLLTEYWPEKEAYQFTKLDPNEDKTSYEQNSITISHDQLADLAQACTEVVRQLSGAGKYLLGAAAARDGQ